ncbi:MAG TPA: PLP-dependent aspartate aminotransferase family protein [Bacteroidales bacterium]|jgi:cystathionine beta-lyase/cystathionine gamma-synthase|nr:PLP-dependent transferase [Bacteroidales bacterium]HNT94093.1 PLP-dependent aspartate aminotransferase family protein [Bacteroidales bacterium]HOO67585.1 PLP-dependent aspartate aminotransferase family protein [Bacteroidales bacterium]HPE21907.1 PLP-dependent aspartate aminotransferase family protein [Bacteroidales bacterium]HPJ06157.1 PLP-dependent aspartate aminotransferase family protein [Bacteroidales bacterium]
MKKREINSVRTPVYRDSGFELPTAGATSGAFTAETDHEREPDQYIYSRYRNPTVVAAEEAVMELECCDWALLAQSGMAAIDIALSIFQEAGRQSSWLFFSEIYGGTLSYISSVLQKRRGLEVSFFKPAEGRYDYALLENTLSDTRPDILYFETISNPLLIVAEGRRVIELGKRYGATVIVDNTFATPLLWKPLDDGADLVIHSATKYLSGHGNVTAGVICGNDKALMQAAVEYRKFVGHMLSPDDAYRLQTQMASFSLRFRQQCDNASDIATLLNSSEKVSRVLYPGLEAHVTHAAAKELTGGKGYGAMITFDLAGATPEARRKNRDRFIAAVYPEIRLIPTLGDNHTILMPVEPVWGARYPEPGMIRLSVGFEDSERLLTILNRGLES